MDIYIDESGNLGKDGPYFIIAYISSARPKRLKNIFKRACLLFGAKGIPLDEIKASKLLFPQKQDLLTKMVSTDDFRCGYIVTQKTHLFPRVLEDKNVCYNYLCAILLKPLLQGKTDDMHVILDNHTQKVTSINSLEGHLKIKAYTEWGYRGVLTIEYQDSRNCYLLQAVDLIANVIYGKYTYGKQHGLYGLLAGHLLFRNRFPKAKFTEITSCQS